MYGGSGDGRQPNVSVLRPINFTSVRGPKFIIETLKHDFKRQHRDLDLH